MSNASMTVGEALRSGDPAKVATAFQVGGLAAAFDQVMVETIEVSASDTVTLTKAAAAVVGLMVTGNGGGTVINDTATLTIASGVTCPFTATKAGKSRLKIALVDPGGTTATLSASASDDGTDITLTVSLGRSGSALDTTAAQLKAFINGNWSWLVTMGAITGTSSTVCAALSATALTGAGASGTAALGPRAVGSESVTPTSTFASLATTVDSTTYEPTSVLTFEGTVTEIEVAYLGLAWPESAEGRAALKASGVSSILDEPLAQL